MKRSNQAQSQPSPDAEVQNTTSAPVITGRTGESPESQPRNVVRGSRGRFLPGTRANPNGRPRRNTSDATLFARALLEENAPTLFKKAIDEAHAGNPIALKLCLDRLLPVMQDRTVRVPIPILDKTPNDILAAHTAVLRAVASGDITPQEGQHMSTIVEARRRSWESVELAERMTELETRLEESTAKNKKKR